MSSFTVRPSARIDIEDQHFYLFLDSPSAADRFLEKCHETFSWLAKHPHVGRPWRGDSVQTRGLRVWNVGGFPNHLIFYRPNRRSIAIVRVLAGNRDLDRLLS
ncbi:MAG: type II toxin-antitoxin system RelE/ParE family toxin [Phycisphaerales bacterium]|nr:type II toxin-antitoxin system RelE/ParE family toxin [Phycisphaerales bacterium]